MNDLITTQQNSKKLCVLD